MFLFVFLSVSVAHCFFFSHFLILYFCFLMLPYVFMCIVLHMFHVLFFPCCFLFFLFFHLRRPSPNSHLRNSDLILIIKVCLRLKWLKATLHPTLQDQANMKSQILEMFTGSLLHEWHLGLGATVYREHGTRGWVRPGLKPMVRGSTILRNHQVSSIEPYIAKHLLVISTSVNLLQIINKGCLKARANTFSL